MKKPIITEDDVARFLADGGRITTIQSADSDQVSHKTHYHDGPEESILSVIARAGDAFHWIFKGKGRRYEKT